MINFLVPLRPDEILASFVARHKYFTHSNTSDTCLELFGRTQISLNTFLPNMRHLNTSVLSNNNLSKDDIEKNHTLHPLYRTGFLNKKNLSRPHLILGGKYEIKSNELKYCPKCVREDQLNFGEAYWHRVHNIPNIIICSKHNTFLNAWSIPLSHRSRNNLFCLEEVVMCPGEATNNTNSDLLEFTRRVEIALLANDPPLKKQIFDKALACTLLTRKGKKISLQSTKFSNLITSFFNDVNIHTGAGFRRIKAALSVSNKFCDPLTLIAIDLLCEKMQSLVKGEPLCPKLPCNNKICLHYKTTNKITSQFYELNHRRTEGLIQKCSACGYSIIFNIRRNKLLYIVDYGHLLLESVIDLVSAGGTYLSASRKLGICSKAISKLFNTRSSISVDLISSPNKTLVEQRREFWKTYLGQNEIKNLSKLTGYPKTVYRFLQINDSPWLITFNKKSGLTKIKASGRPMLSFNDEEIVGKLKQAKSDLLQSNVSRRVSKQCLLRHVSIQGLTFQKISQLMNTSQFLNTESETLLQWKKRKIKKFIQDSSDPLTVAQVLDKFKSYRNTKPEQQELKDFVNKLIIN